MRVIAVLVLMASAQDRRHFLESARDCCGASTDEFPGTVLHDGRRVAVEVRRWETERFVAHTPVPVPIPL